MKTFVSMELNFFYCNTKKRNINYDCHKGIPPKSRSPNYKNVAVLILFDNLAGLVFRKNLSYCYEIYRAKWCT